MNHNFNDDLWWKVDRLCVYTDHEWRGDLISHAVFQFDDFDTALIECLQSELYDDF